jgi:hypothetical protein
VTIFSAPILNKEFLVKSIAILILMRLCKIFGSIVCYFKNHNKFRFYRKIVTLFSFIFSGAQEHLRKNVCMIPHRIPVGVMISVTEFKDYISKQIVDYFLPKVHFKNQVSIELQFLHNSLRNLIQMKCKLEKKYFA